MTATTPEHVDVLIIGSGPVGATYARTIGDLRPDARILMVEVGPPVPGVRGEHSQNMSDDARVAAQLLTQGPDAGIERAAALSDIAAGIDPSLEFRQTILPGIFFVDPRPDLREGEVGLPAASMSSGVGGMGIHWGSSSPRPHQLSVAATAHGHPAHDYFVQRRARARTRFADGVLGDSSSAAPLSADDKVTLVLAMIDGLRIQGLLDPATDPLPLLDRFMGLLMAGTKAPRTPPR